MNVFICVLLIIVFLPFFVFGFILALFSIVRLFFDIIDVWKLLIHFLSGRWLFDDIGDDSND